MLNGGIIEDVKFVISGKQESIQIEGIPSPICRKSVLPELSGTIAFTNSEGILSLLIIFIFQIGVAVLDHPTGIYDTLIAQKGKDVVFIQNVSSLLRGNSFKKIIWHIFNGFF